MLDKVKSRPSWFFCPPGESDPQLAEDLTQAQEQAERLLRKNRDDAMGGYFPVGPAAPRRSSMADCTSAWGAVKGRRFLRLSPVE